MIKTLIIQTLSRIEVVLVVVFALVLVGVSMANIFIHFIRGYRSKTTTDAAMAHPDPNTDSNPDPDPNTDSNPDPDPNTDSNPDPDPNTDPDPATGTTAGSNSTPESPSEDATADVEQLRDRATEALIQAEKAEANGQYQQAADRYEEAIDFLDRGIPTADHVMRKELETQIDEVRPSLDAIQAATYVTRKELETKFDEIRPSLDAIKAVAEQDDPGSTDSKPATDGDSNKNGESRRPPSDGTSSGDGDQPRERAADPLTRGKKAEANGQYQQAVDAYDEAINQFEQALAAADDEMKVQAEIEETRTLLEAVTASRDQRESVATTLQTAERSFNEAIARYVAGSQTAAHIRFRQARDAFEEAQQAIDDSDAEMLAQPIEVSFEQEATLPSLALEELAVLDESTLETLAAVDIESITDLESDPEEMIPPVISDLEESDEISSEETALLTILSWWYEGASRELTSETVISRRYEQSDYGFYQSS